MKVPASLVTPDGEVVSYGELKSYLRAVRYDTAKRWASKKSREELEHIIAALFARNRVWAGIPSRNQKTGNNINRQFWEAAKRKLAEAPAKARRELAKNAAEAMLKNNPKQHAKSKAKELWLEWQAGGKIHKSGAAFARYVISALPDIESEKTVERWVAVWRKDSKGEANANAPSQSGAKL